MDERCKLVLHWLKIRPNKEIGQNEPNERNIMAVGFKRFAYISDNPLYTLNVFVTFRQILFFDSMSALHNMDFSHYFDMTFDFYFSINLAKSFEINKASRIVLFVPDTSSPTAF